MSLTALAGFAQGFADSRERVKDRKEREANAARQDRLIDALGAAPVPGAAPGGERGNLSWENAGYGRAEPAAMGASPRSGSLMDLLDATEGGSRYDTLYGNAQNGGRFDGVDVTKMTLGQVYDFSAPDGEYGQWVKQRLADSGQEPRVATPMGRGQIVGTTLRGAAKELGLPDDTVFGPKVQDQIIGHLAQRRLSSAKTPIAKRAALRSEWEGFKRVSDEALDAAIAKYEAGGGQMRPMPLGAPTQGRP